MAIQSAEVDSINPDKLDTGEAARWAVKLAVEVWRELQSKTAKKEDVLAVAKTVAKIERKQDEIAEAEAQALSARANTYRTKVAKKNE